VLCGGGGIPARLYRRFAAWLASRGVPVLTYDNRGIGASRPARMRGFDAGVEAWSDHDCAAAIAWLRTRYPGGELIGIAHSIGGLVLTSARNAESLARFLLVGVHTGYWGDYHPLWRLPMTLMWHGVMPALTRLCGYFPGRLVGMGSDLPARFAGQWARRTTPAIRYEGERFDACLARGRSVRGAALALTFTDDGFATARGTRRLLELFPKVEAQHRVIAPRDAGLGGIGHFGFFRASAEGTLWPAVHDWMVK
jgi:predicted alpha/beta hydrolase